MKQQLLGEAINVKLLYPGHHHDHYQPRLIPWRWRRIVMVGTHRHNPELVHMVLLPRACRSGNSSTVCLLNHRIISLPLLSHGSSN